MSILIKGMEMPVFEHDSWDIRKGTDGKWYVVDTNAETTDGEWHEIIPVPPHGRLIDADAFTQRIDDESKKFYAMNEYDSGLRAGYRASMRAAKLTPTIIESEE